MGVLVMLLRMFQLQLYLKRPIEACGMFKMGSEFRGVHGDVNEKVIDWWHIDAEGVLLQP